MKMFRRRDNLAENLSEQGSSLPLLACGKAPVIRLQRHLLSADLFSSAWRYRLLLSLFVAILYLGLCLPLIQLQFRIFDSRGLNGVSVPNARPAIKLKSLLKESYQKGMEEWFMKRNGLYGYMVRASNQLSFSLFGQISANYFSSVLLGRDGQFFQPMYLNSFNRTENTPVTEMEDRVRKLKTLQELLAKHNVSFLLLITTNVLALYPEIVPAAYTDPSRLGRKNNYELMLSFLDKYGVNYLDVHQFLMREKSSSPVRLFVKTGSHWNDVAACRITDLLVQKFEQLLGKKLIRFTCEPIKTKYPPRSEDLDLVAIANLLFAERTFRPAPYPESQTIKQGDEYKPKVLFVGTSFVMSILRFLGRHDVLEQSLYYFYYNQVMDSRTGAFQMLNRKKIDWQKRVLSKDLVVIENNQAARVGFRFLDDAIERISAIPPRVEPR